MTKKKNEGTGKSDYDDVVIISFMIYVAIGGWMVTGLLSFIVWLVSMIVGALIIGAIYNYKTKNMFKTGVENE